MNINLSCLQMPQMIPVNVAAINISTWFAEQADELADMRHSFQVHKHLLGHRKRDIIEQMIDWHDIVLQ